MLCHCVFVSPKSHSGGDLICSAGPVITALQGGFGGAPALRGRLGGCCGSVGTALGPPSMHGAAPAVSGSPMTRAQRLQN